ncbi:stage II sporulation protein M [Paenibacillus sp. ACRRX]|uniref:stage II sporulation protein M n=1 Tax=unclassified Paenibacillus TaxID=185978 RepID=UPI001EF57356|nr:MULTISPECIES: stage II sporulation protein M [unclassified Paenibacillus]MCG7406342.1 stage II sporulation protein M [Paenibacillus sp. ACRRX]MDK8179377.1 stage II sporulation protein M [Paenibacillus sp. UMB4589-SE434]
MPAMMPNVRQHLHLYIFVSVIFAVGIVFGALLVNTLTFEQQQELSRQLNQAFVSVAQNADETTFLGTLWSYWRWVFMIALFGLSIIGFPLVLIMDFAKGVLVGFTIGTLVGQYSWKGVIIALITVAPQNAIAIPLLLIASVSSISLALYVMKNRLFVQRIKSLREPLLHYATVQVGAGIGMAAVAAIVTWISPALMNWVSTLIHPGIAFNL